MVAAGVGAEISAGNLLRAASALASLRGRQRPTVEDRPCSPLKGGRVQMPAFPEWCSMAGPGPWGREYIPRRGLERGRRSVPARPKPEEDLPCCTASSTASGARQSGPDPVHWARERGEYKCPGCGGKPLQPLMGTFFSRQPVDTEHIVPRDRRDPCEPRLSSWNDAGELDATDLGRSHRTFGTLRPS
jgi:hypothetical protein